MSKRLQDAISALADLYEYGHLMASATPADFLMQVAQEIVSLRAESAELAALRARCERREGDPTVEQVRLLADPAWVEPSDAMGHCRMMTARALMRAWGEEA